MPIVEDLTTEMLTSYNELNGSIIEEFHSEPDPLQFMRHVANNRPFVIRGGCSDWPAVQKWDCQYLRNVLAQTLVRVAVTRHGSVRFYLCAHLADSRAEKCTQVMLMHQRALVVVTYIS